MSEHIAKGGRVKDVIVRVLSRNHDGPYGETVELDYDRLSVWADPELGPLMSQIEGVMLVAATDQVGNHYIVAIDPRYDTQYIMSEVQAVAEIHATENKLKGVFHNVQRPV